MAAAAGIAIVAFVLGCQQSGPGTANSDCTAVMQPRALSKLPSGMLQLASLKIGSSSLSEAIGALGDAQRLPRRETDPNVVCYTWNGLHLYLEAGAAGGWKILTGYELRKTEREDGDVCAKSNVDLSSSRASSLLQSAGTRLQLVKQLGKPTCEGPNLLRYRYEKRQVDKAPGGRRVETDMVATIKFSFLKGELESVAVNYIETT